MRDCDKKDYDVVLRGHHLRTLCSFYFRHMEQEIREYNIENGHSKKMVNNAIKVFKKITNSNVRVKIVEATDDICKFCKPRRKNSSCNDWMTIMDDKLTAEFYGLRTNKIYPSEYILQRIAEKEGYYGRTHTQ